MRCLYSSNPQKDSLCVNNTLFSKKKLAFFLATSCLLAGTANAASIYVDAENGSDANTGSLSSPYKTIGKALTKTTAAVWDNIYLAPGKYREKVSLTSAHQRINFRQTPNTLGDAIITGADELPYSRWTNLNNGTFSAALTASEVETEYTQLFESDKAEQIARCPNNTSGKMLDPLVANSGYFVLVNGEKKLGSSRASIAIHDPQNNVTLPSSFSNEAIFRGLTGKLRNNIFSRNNKDTTKNAALSSTPNYDELAWTPSDTWGNGWTGNAAYSVPEGFGYILDFNCMDIPGEWFYKRNTNTIYYKPSSAADMRNKVIEVQKRKYAFYMVGAKNITLDGIHVRAGSLYAQDMNRLKIVNSSFKHMRPFKYVKGYSVADFHDGVVLKNSDNTIIDGSYIGKTWTSGVSVLAGSDNTTVTNSIIEDVGWLGLFTSSLFSEGGSMTIANNTFGKSGRFHLRIQSNAKNVITGNEFYGAMSLGEDAGSISYTSGSAGSQHYNLSGTEISFNMIYDVLGLPSFDTSPAYKGGKAVAFYMEDVSNYIIHHNVVNNVGVQDYTSPNGYTNGSAYNVDGKILYMGPRVREMLSNKTGNYERIRVFNNTFWNYTKLVTSWQMYNTGTNNSIVFNGGLEAEFKNNIHQAKTGQTEIKRQNVIVTDPTTWDYDKIANSGMDEYHGNTYSDFISVYKAAPFYSTNMYQSKNLALAGDKDTHFKSGNRTFRPLTLSGEFVGGNQVEGVQSVSTSIELGAFEGDNWAARNKVFEAGAPISAASFNIGYEQ